MTLYGNLKLIKTLTHLRDVNKWEINFPVELNDARVM